MRINKSTLRVAIILVLVFMTMFKAPDLRASAQENQGRIAFVSDRDGNYEIYVMNADGSGQTNLTNDSARDIEPTWSPDGEQIAFVSSRDGEYSIYIMNADGSEQVRLTNKSTDDHHPAWSPDGKQIAFGRLIGNKNQIFVINVDGSNLSQLTNTQEFNSYPTWSPDGKSIAFISNGSAGSAIRIMKADGSGITALVNHEYPDIQDLDWSPNGNQIVFRYNSGTWKIYNMDIYVINADGSGETILTKNAENNDEAPSWSTDGKRIVFASGRDVSRYQIYAMNSDGSQVVRLTNNSAFDEDPDWSPAAGQSSPPTEQPTQEPLPPTESPIPTETPQQNTVTIMGRVADGHDNALANLKIQIVGAPQGEDVTYTKPDGTYTWNGVLQPGTYTVQAWLEDSNGRRKVLIGAQQTPVWTGRSLNVTTDQNQYTVNIDFGAQGEGITDSIPEQDRLAKAAWVYARTREIHDFIAGDLGYTPYMAPQMIRLWIGDPGWGEWAKYVPKTSTDSNSIPGTIEVSVSLSDNVLDKNPIFLWHEEFHYLSEAIIPDVGVRDSNETGCNHAGVALNSNSRDSLAEGWAEFWPAVKAGNGLWYFPRGESINLEVDYKSWETAGSGTPLCDKDGRYTGAAQLEEYAVAGLLWDLYDAKYDSWGTDKTGQDWSRDGEWYERDPIELGANQLFSIIASAKEAKPPVKIKTVADLYRFLAPRISTLRNLDGSEITIDHLDQLWINHGFFEDTNHNQQYNSGENFEWRNPPPIPNAYLILDSLADGSRPENVQLEIQVKDTIASYGFSYTVDIDNWPYSVYVIPPLPERVGMVEINLVQNGQVTETYSIDNQTYWERVNDPANEQNRRFTLRPTDVQQPLTGLRLLINSYIQDHDGAFFGASVQSGGEVNYAWNFGDGATATGQLTNHEYSEPGSYTVTVTASNNLGSTTQTKTINVEENETNRQSSQSLAERVQENIIWMLASVLVVSFTGLVIILLLMNRRKMAFSRAGTKPRRVPAKQTAPVGKSAIVSAPLVSQPITAPSVSIEQRVNTAIALSKAGKHQESFAMLKEVVKVDPNNAQAWLYLGVNLVNLKDFVNAERCIQRAKALGHPQADQARNWLAKKRDGNQS